MQDSLWRAEELQILQRSIQDGFRAESTLADIENILSEMEVVLFEQFSIADPLYYQKLDSPHLLVLHLKQRVIRELKQTLMVRVEKGKSASEQRAQLEERGVRFNGK